MSVMKTEILFFAMTDFKNQLSRGRALKPRPYKAYANI